MSAYARAVIAAVTKQMTDAAPEIMAVLRAAVVWRDSPQELSDKALSEAFDRLPAELQKLLRA